ncbi:hypothetical protein I7F13_16230 [Sinorhizobium meliloti]|uniref:hypothetical protein n=1 Tax=Rhizobium meliloti TaxID=382 RepID=UPI000FDA7309|nr:hypothetical protein [Sinorhizobium meliloti]MCM5692559.1 hypothetical protein [Sinorhizobium meliloti]MDE3823760.1 hypothetical protein [Sinorhizobium meliloti]RVI01067.1 hypothetical protein CN205_30945 [Sinorhizobium meliloti]RVM45675.1 hypothetical protein CN127_21740 [Sinorhizobium meliloti]RVN55566.1 hypothetical protein CN106_34840 [Sinorhizobium meliloti]
MKAKIDLHAAEFQPRMRDHDVVGAIVDVPDNGSAGNSMRLREILLECHGDLIAGPGKMVRYDETIEEIDRCFRDDAVLAIVAIQQTRLAIS